MSKLPEETSEAEEQPGADDGTPAYCIAGQINERNTVCLHDKQKRGGTAAITKTCEMHKQNYTFCKNLKEAPKNEVLAINENKFNIQKRPPNRQ